MALTSVDRALLDRCLKHDTGAWNDFVDRFLGLIYHVIQYTAHLRSQPIKPEELEDIAQEVLLQIVANDYAVLRQFRGHSSLATYLTVITRRMCVVELMRRRKLKERVSSQPEILDSEDRPTRLEASIEGLEEVQKLLKRLPSKERKVVRMFYLEGRTYEEISIELDIPVNSIGSILSRAKKKLKEGTGPSPSVK